MSAPDYVLATGAARDEARAAVVAAVGADPAVSRMADGRTVVAFYAGTGTYGIRIVRVPGDATHYAVNRDTYAGPDDVPTRYRKARTIAYAVAGAVDVIDAYAAAHRASDDARDRWQASTFWHVVVDGARVERHATETGAMIGAARHVGATIEPPAVTS